MRITMKKQTTAAFLCLALTIAGCSQQPVKSEKEDHVSPAKQASSHQEKPDQKPVKKKEVSWDGQWVYLSSDNLATLTIKQTTEQEITYKLIGSYYNPDNRGSYGNSFEGKGMIEGDKLTFTNVNNEECGGTMIKQGNSLTFRANNGACHTPAVYLDGEYKKADTITPPQKLNYQDGEFKIFGIALGDLPEIPKKHLGNPEYEGPDEENFYNWMVQEYPKQDVFIAYSYDNEAETIFTTASLEELEALTEKFDRDHYIDGNGRHYLYNPDNYHLLIYDEKAEEPIRFFATYPDNNFFFSIKSKEIWKQ